MEIVLPPLRERREDIVPMAKFFLADVGARYGNPDLHFSPQHLQMLERYPWYGNVRELENKIERAVILSDSNEISAADLDILDFDPPEAIDQPNPELSDLERSAIEKALFTNKGTISKTADQLGLSRAALYRRMEKYNLKGS